MNTIACWFGSLRSCISKRKTPWLTFNDQILTFIGNIGQNNCMCVCVCVCVCVRALGIVIQGDEQVNDRQMIKGGVSPEQLRMEKWRGENQLICPLKLYHIGYMLL